MFANTKIIKNNRSSSIVIKFDENRGVSEFQLPVGFDNFPEDSYELKKELFFKTYHTYRKFIEEKKAIIDKNNLSNTNKKIESIDTVTETNKEYRFKDGVNGEIITYQKLVMFDSILDAYDELRIQSLQDKISKSEFIDYTRIHKYLHQAIYLKNDVIYIDEIDLPKKVVKDASTELVEMFCYIYSEVLNQFAIISNNHKVATLANNFKEKRLFEESSLFSEDCFDDTILILKDVLDEINQSTAYKDFDYWHFHDAIYNFIYSSNDGYWTLDNFSFIWERMCLAFAKKYYKEQISLYDNFGKLVDTNKYNSIRSCFNVWLNKNDNDFDENNKPKTIRPDLVLNDTDLVLEENFIHKIYEIISTNKGYIINHRNNVDYSAYSDVEKIRFDILGRNRFNISEKKLNQFIKNVQSLLSNKNYFDLGTRYPKIVKSINTIEKRNSYLIIDYKYINEAAFKEILDTQINNAVSKQIVYELVLKLNRNANTKSEFWIPAFLSQKNCDTQKPNRKYCKNCDTFFKKYRISVYQLDFLTLQQLYIQDVS